MSDGIHLNPENLFGSFASYENIEGFTYDVKRNTDNEYTVVYTIDFDKIQDNDLTTFNLDRDLSTLQTTYENQGYTCK